MNVQNKSMDEILRELEELKQENIVLKEKLNNSTPLLITANADGNTSIQESISSFNVSWQRTFDGIKDGIMLLNKASQIVYANQSINKLVNRDDNDIFGKYCWEIFHESSERVAGCPFLKMHNSKKRESMELSLDGLWYDVTVDPIFDDKGEIDGVVHIMSDITHRKIIESDLRESRQVLRYVLDTLPMRVFWKDVDLKYIDCNLNFALDAGFNSPDEIIGKDDHLICWSEQANGYRSDDLIVIESGKAKLNYEESLNLPDGTIIRVNTSKFPLVDSNGKIYGVLGIYQDVTERKNAEEALLVSEERLRLSLEASLQGWFDLNVQTGDVTVSPEYARMLGYEPEEFKSDFKGWFDSIHPDDKENVQTAFKKCIDSGGTHSMEYRRTTKSGEWLWVCSIGKIVEYDADNKPLKMMGTQSNINKQKNAEMALLESEEKFRGLVESTSDMVWETSIDGLYTYISPQIEELLGYSPAEAIFRSPFDFSLSNGKENLIKQSNSIVESGLPFSSLENKMVHKNGQVLIFETSGVPLFDKSGKLKGYRGISRDITKRKQAEEALKVSEERFRELSNMLPQIVYETDINGNLTFVNQTAFELFGYSQCDFENGISAVDTIVPEERQLAMARIKETLTNNDSTKTEYTALKKDGSTFPILVFSSVIIHNKIPVGLRGIIIDITEQKLAEEKIIKLNAELEHKVKKRTAELQMIMEQLQESNYELQILNEQVIEDSHKILTLNEELVLSQQELKKALETKDKFFSIIAHDLRNPFVALLNGSDLLLNYHDNLEVSDRNKLILSIRDASKFTHSLLENLLQWSASQMGSIPFNPEIIDFYDLANQTRNLLQQQADIKGVNIIISLPKGTMVYCDMEMIKTIARNLISNGIKYSLKGGNVEIGIYKPISDYDKSVDCIFVRDNGIGLDQETMSKLFKVDQRVSRKGTDGESSSGLGLLLCKEFIDKHAGRIWVESAEDAGSTFYFTLPKNEV